ncbi:DNA-binding GntR family transcriptional regulator [Loktanella ponticola]|uniref:DNA-binding GntR family transcriptional regulator n=1 Tax=Yoonia ponticola TaxID=1524255 RepID=A0A7W9BIX7_9RHOB|nr:hypothetical protein [Yoonia ponticola]MBB5720959.1 DNA-binding GntR family transcriptional regulator [Yoonia ponticola]
MTVLDIGSKAVSRRFLGRLWAGLRRLVPAGNAGPQVARRTPDAVAELYECAARMEDIAYDLAGTESEARVVKLMHLSCHLEAFATEIAKRDARDVAHRPRSYIPERK